MVPSACLEGTFSLPSSGSVEGVLCGLAYHDKLLLWQVLESESSFLIHHANAFEDGDEVEVSIARIAFKYFAQEWLPSACTRQHLPPVPCIKQGGNNSC